MYTPHAIVRMQQRGIPREVVECLIEFGARAYDHRGARIRFFDAASRRRLLHEQGRGGIRVLEGYRDAYAVESVDGDVVTVGHRYRRIRRY